MQVHKHSARPESVSREAEVEADTLGATFLVRGGDGGELAVPRLPRAVPAADLYTQATHTVHSIFILLFKYDT